MSATATVVRQAGAGLSATLRDDKLIWRKGPHVDVTDAGETLISGTRSDGTLVWVTGAGDREEGLRYLETFLSPHCFCNRTYPHRCVFHLEYSAYTEC